METDVKEILKPDWEEIEQGGAGTESELEPTGTIQTALLGTYSRGIETGNRTFHWKVNLRGTVGIKKNTARAVPYPDLLCLFWDSSFLVWIFRSFPRIWVVHLGRQVWFPRGTPLMITRGQKLNTNFILPNFSGTAGISQQNPGISCQSQLAEKQQEQILLYNFGFLNLQCYFWEKFHRKSPLHPGRNKISRPKSLISWFRGTYQAFWPPPLHVEDPYANGKYPDSRVWACALFLCLTLTVVIVL